MWVGGPIVITGSERNGSFRVTGRYSTDIALNAEDRARSNECRWCLDVSGDKREHFPLGSPEGTQSC